ncbi:MAG TPA: hypothetical protein VGG74_11540 [Kofleriaceae bacterium]|jgi:hypothetical protein
MDQRSPVHEIVSKLWAALTALEIHAPTRDIERWGFSIHGAISAPGREYHNHEHVIEIATADDPLEVIAALYHDAVYIQVDLGPPSSMLPEISSALEEVDGGWRVLPRAGDDQATADVLAVFGRKVGDVVTSLAGLNEIASALVASIQLSRVLDRMQRLAIAACIEQTIPFRNDPVTPLRDRLAGLGIAGAQLDQLVTRALRLGNRDVENFADNDPARFLDNTWKLLPESNPALHLPSVYSVRDYRIALHRMEGFLAHLPAERVFHSFGDEPGMAVHARRVARTTGNLELAVRYLRAKLYSIALVEAVAEATGGDVPVDYFMGGMKHPQRPDMKRIEQFLPHLGSVKDLDPPLHRLLSEGRASESSFDTRPSPIGAFLMNSVGEAPMLAGVEHAKRWWAGGCTVEDFIASQPAKPIGAIARAAGHIMETRRDRLFALAERLES